MCYRSEAQPVRLMIWGAATPFAQLVVHESAHASYGKQDLLTILVGLLFSALSLGLQPWMRSIKPFADPWLPPIRTKAAWKHQKQQVSHLRLNEPLWNT